eukprot:11733754-Alexandrium_andersonii.AAC.1
MDTQVVRDGHACCKYILGYVLKSDTDAAAEKRFEEFVGWLAHGAGAGGHGGGGGSANPVHRG